MPCWGRGAAGRGCRQEGQRLQGRGKAAPALAGSGERVVSARFRLVSKRYSGIPAGTALLLLRTTDLTQSCIPEMLCQNGFM